MSSSGRIAVRRVELRRRDSWRAAAYETWHASHASELGANGAISSCNERPGSRGVDDAGVLRWRCAPWDQTTPSAHVGAATMLSGASSRTPRTSAHARLVYSLLVVHAKAARVSRTVCGCSAAPALERPPVRLFK